MHDLSERPNLERLAITPASPAFRRSCIAIASFTLAGCFPLLAEEFDTDKLPPPAKMTVDFDRDVKPILENSCLRCHGAATEKSHFRLDDRESALRGGDNNADNIVPGDSARSRLIHYVAGPDADIQMPPPDKADPLTPEQVGLLRSWIDQGAAWPTNTVSSLTLSLAPTLRWISVDGNRAKFREIEGLKDGWVGGIERFELRERLSPDTSFAAEGFAMFGDESYQLRLALEKHDVGFVHAGFETQREFYDDTGGFAPLLPTNSIALNRDLHLDVGRLWFEVGLTRPDVPQVVLGYEYQFKEGDKSTLQWGPIGTLPVSDPATDAKNVYPAFKHIDEHTHILKLDVRHELRGWEIEDNARVEFYDLHTRRQNVTQHTFGTAPDSVAVVIEKYQHVSGANTLNVTKQIREWLTVSSGWLYSRLDGDGSFNQSTLDGGGAFIFGDQWIANRLNLKRESQVVSLAGAAGPWSGLTLSVGAQGEWTRQESVGNEDLRIGDPGVPVLFSDASIVTGNLDSHSARENVLLRFTKIPFTVVTAEARLQQESLARFDERPDGNDPFTRDTVADIGTQEYRVGFNSSPWSRFSFGASFKHRDKRTDYTHLEFFHPVGYLYPGFLVWRDIENNQADVRLVYRFAPWLRTSLNYRWQATDFDSATRPVDGVSPGGSLDAANYEAHVYSVNIVATPIQRLYLSSTFSYSDSRTRTAQNDAGYLAPWRGDGFSVLSSAAFAVTPETNLRASYAYSKSDYGQGNAQTGLPAGINYDRHAVQFAVAQRFAGNVVASLGYGFYQYHEPHTGGAGDYRAHAIFASATIPWP